MPHQCQISPLFTGIFLCFDWPSFTRSPWIRSNTRRSLLRITSGDYCRLDTLWCQTNRVQALKTKCYKNARIRQKLSTYVSLQFAYRLTYGVFLNLFNNNNNNIKRTTRDDWLFCASLCSCRNCLINSVCWLQLSVSWRWASHSSDSSWLQLIRKSVQQLTNNKNHQFTLCHKKNCSLFNIL